MDELFDPQSSPNSLFFGLIFRLRSLLRSLLCCRLLRAFSTFCLQRGALCSWCCGCAATFPPRTRRQLRRLCFVRRSLGLASLCGRLCIVTQRDCHVTEMSLLPIGASLRRG